MTDQSFLASGGFTGVAGYGLQNQMGLAALALWLISSTIAAPIILQKAIATGAQVGQGLVTTATTAGIAGATAGAGAAAAFWRGRICRIRCRCRSWWRRSSAGRCGSIHQRQLLFAAGQYGRLNRKLARHVASSAQAKEERPNR